MVVRLFALVVLFFAAIYQLNQFMYSDKYKNINEDAKLSAKLQNGDIIFRKKDDDVIDKSFSIDNLGYSQVGIVVTSGENAVVFYLKSDEKQSFLKAQKVEDFVKSSDKIAVYKYFTDIDKNVLLAILEFYKNNHDKLYNTEFINEVFFKLHGENLYTDLQNINNKKIITVDSIIKNSKLKKRYEIDFKEKI
ncbi:YiiX/YebB-like N1pC/P60 family cysteine hydrolase [Arcobacter lacus]|uniref:YiiX/YebB-like N1pC/P60 family cysteine hydrolase n=1 Tax=Arcobacter lacus TaxID=1912876 RepID=UPI0021BB8B1C|nr:YiiX/YebB-like N1pC/P60 family cysteine hydrolase [Arcobacter lacus]MCT7909175.1 YiiX/YebB-like N1pC/P60 family cysteine hydrolase [Arcobacter lacus]